MAQHRRVAAGVSHSHQPAATTTTWLTRHATRCAAHAEERGVLLGLQNHNHGSMPATGEQLCRLLDDVGSPWVVGIMDTGQWKWSPGVGPKHGEGTEPGEEESPVGQHYLDHIRTAGDHDPLPPLPRADPTHTTTTAHPTRTPSNHHNNDKPRSHKRLCCSAARVECPREVLPAPERDGGLAGLRRDCEGPSRGKHAACKR
eukprot:COSAG04_NODE_1969_length_5111_cov_5.551676_3_plen_201_part_00